MRARHSRRLSWKPAVDTENMSSRSTPEALIAKTEVRLYILCHVQTAHRHLRLARRGKGSKPTPIARRHRRDDSPQYAHPARSACRSRRIQAKQGEGRPGEQEEHVIAFSTREGGGEQSRRREEKVRSRFVAPGRRQSQDTDHRRRRCRHARPDRGPHGTRRADRAD
jgi:hypothetical protein